MNDWIAQLRKLVDERTPRERWMLVAAAAVVVFLITQLAVVNPLQERAERARVRTTQLDGQILQARRAAAEIRRLQGGVEAVQARIQTSEKTDLLALLERLAARAAVKDRIESMKPTPVSGNEEFPETRVQVSLRGATLEQTVRFLHSIEAADAHLIMRSLQIRRSRGRGDTGVLDVTFSVSSFERA